MIQRGTWSLLVASSLMMMVVMLQAVGSTSWVNRSHRYRRLIVPGQYLDVRSQGQHYGQKRQIWKLCWCIRPTGDEAETPSAIRQKADFCPLQPPQSCTCASKFYLIGRLMFTPS